RHLGDVKSLGKRAGLDPLAKLHELATMSAAGALRTSISWRKSRDRARMTTLSRSQAAALQGLIGSAHDSETERLNAEGQLVGIDDARGTFRFEATDGAQIEGRLAEEFPRGQAWVMNTALEASLTRTSRIDYASGARKEEWALRALTPIE
ncbi:MAG: hypothetical protein GY788_06700, partial [bacterium]|nr:hypothetical protein [bacterium]